MQVVLDDEGEQHVPRSRCDVEEPCDRERRPEPGSRTNEREALADLAPGGSPEPRLEGPRGHEQRGRARGAERGSVDKQSRPCARDGDYQSREGGADDARNWTHELVERVRLRQQFARHDLGHDRPERWRKERVADTGGSSTKRERPQLQPAGDRKRTCGTDRERADHIGRDHYLASLDAVGENAAEE